MAGGLAIGTLFRRVVLFVLCLLMSGSLPHDGSWAASSARYVPGELLVRFHLDVPPAARQRTRDRFKVSRIRRYRNGLERLRVDPQKDLEVLARELTATAEVFYAEPNYLFTLTRQPDDPFYLQQYWLDNAGQTGGTPGSDLRAAEAWDITTGSREVIVAIIDSGIDLNHPDLLPNIWVNPGEIPGNGIDDDNNGYIDDVHGWDFVNDDNDPFDDNDHGSHVAGIVGAVGDNGRGVSGVAWKVSLMPLKFANASGTGTSSDAAAAIDYAVAMGARISNNSWSGPGFSRLLRDTIQRAGEADHLFVAAAGNNGRDIDQIPEYPVAYDLDNIIGVMATTDDDQPAFFTNFGSDSVDIAAAGDRVLSTVVGGVYRHLNGTSMAAPQVAGVAALALSVAPNIPAVSLKEQILQAATPRPILLGLNRTGGRIDAAAVLQSIDTVPPAAVTDLAVLDIGSTRAAIMWTAPGDDGMQGTVWRYVINVDGERMLIGPSPLPAGSPQQFEILGLEPDHQHSIFLQGQDEWGNLGPPSSTLTLQTAPAPTVDVTPRRIDLFVADNEPTTTTLRVENIGPGRLEWRIEGPLGSVLFDRIQAVPPSGRLLGGQSSIIELQFDLAGIAMGSYRSNVKLFNNDPLNQELLLPIFLGIGQRPRLVIGRSVPEEESEASFDLDPLGTTQLLQLASPAVGPMTITIEIEGDYGQSNEFVTVFVDDELLGTVHGGALDCTSGGGSLTLGGQDVERLAADGELELRLLNSPAVGTFCARNVHKIRLSYREPVEQLLFHATPIGSSDPRSIDLINVGETSLFLESVTSGRPADYTLSLQNVFVEPEQSSTLEIVFSPQTVGDLSTSLTIATNEPEAMVATVSLGGVGLDPPILRLQPTRIELALMAGIRTSVVLQVANDGASPLTFGIEPLDAISSAVLTPTPSSGAVAAGQQINIALEVDGTDLTAAVLDLGLQITTNDPVMPTVMFPVELTVSGMPAIAIGPDPIQLESTIRYSTEEAITTHRLPISVPIVGAARLELLADGDFGSSSEHAILFIEGEEQFSVGASGTDCESVGGARSITLEQIAVWSADGLIEATVQNTAEVAAFCLDNLHRLRLIYEGPGGRLEYGDGFIDRDLLRHVVVSNTGSDMLTLQSVTVSGTAFEETPHPMTVAPGAVLLIPIIFRPDEARIFEGSVTIVSNASNVNAIELLLRGRGVATPNLQISPIQLFFSTPLGGTQTQQVTIQNAGDVAVEVSLVAISEDSEQITIQPSVGFIAAGDSLEVSVTVDGADLLPGEREFVILVTGETAQSPQTEIFATWEIIGTPQIGLSVFRFEKISRHEFDSAGATTIHQFEVSQPSVGVVTLSLHILGDFGSIGEQARLFIENQFVLSATGNGADCSPITKNIAISPARFAGWIQDNLVDARVENSTSVGTFCDENIHEVRLSYPTPAASLEYGDVFRDRETTATVEVHSNGNSDLTVLSVSTTGSQFRVENHSFVLAPGASTEIEVTVLPDASGVIDGELLIVSDAIDQPIARLPLRARSFAAPRIDLSPRTIQRDVPPGATSQFDLQVRNGGELPLVYEAVIDVETPEEFDHLAESPGAVTCLLADPIRGHIYAQIRRSTSFIRFDSEGQSWSLLARPPMTTEEFCGVVLLDGLLHVFYSHDRLRYAVYDIALDRWELRQHPMNQNVGAVTSDGARYIYLARLGQLIRHDPKSGDSTPLASTPFLFERDGGLEYLDGYLYGHRGNGSASFARYEIAADRWELLPSPPGGVHSGSTVDPLERAYYVIGQFDSQSIYRFDVDTATWTTIQVDPFPMRRGELAWVGGEHRGVHVGQGELGRGFLRLPTPSGILLPTVSEGSLAPGSVANLSFNLRMDLPSGRYHQRLIVNSNDPDQPIATAILDVTVRGRGRLATAPGAIDSQALVGVTTYQTIELVNRGDGPLQLTGIEIIDREIAAHTELTNPSLPFELPARGRVSINLAWHPTEARSLTTAIRITTEDPDHGETLIPWTAVAQLPAQVDLREERIEVALPPQRNLKTIRELQLGNRGGSPLVWSLSQTIVPESSQQRNADIGRQDAFGYRWRTEDEPGGPLFEWQEIHQTGLQLDLAADDVVSPPISLGFPFEFYGRVVDSVHIASDGWLSFSANTPSYSNASTLPESGSNTPADLIAPFWDDLDLTHRGAVFVDARDDLFIVQYQGVDRFATPSHLTFQVLLHADGRIVFQYLELEGVIDSATIGIQNESRTIGNLVAANEPFLFPGRAIEFRRAPSWLHISPPSGSLQPADPQTISLTFDTAELAVGDYTADLALRTNDPFRTQTSIPVLFHIGEVEPLEIQVPLGSRRDREMVDVYIELPAALDPRTIIPTSVLLHGSLAPLDISPQLSDRDGDGIPEGRLRFDARSFFDLAQRAGDVSLELTGEVRDKTWFRGKFRLRVVDPDRPTGRAVRSDSRR